MAIFLCNGCGHFLEVTNEFVGKSVNCPRCKKSNSVYDTVRLLKYLLGQYRAQHKAFQELREQLTPTDSMNSTVVAQQSFVDIDIHNTDALDDPQQYGPILEWLKQQNIQLDIDHQAIQTTGFFDEIAMQLGDQYDTLKLVSDNIKYIQQKGHTNVKLMLSKNDSKQVTEITNFCRELHDYSFVAKYFYHKRDKIVWLTLQTAPPIVKFFNGEWMEWFVFIKLLMFFLENRISVSCLRSFLIRFPNEDINEIDIFFLIDNTLPLCIECKTGEFRQDINKYSKLRRRLQLEKTQFLICAAGLSEKHIEGFNSMYDVTFANEKNLLQHVEQLVSGSRARAASRFGPRAAQET